MATVAAVAGVVQVVQVNRAAFIFDAVDFVGFVAVHTDRSVVVALFHLLVMSGVQVVRRLLLMAFQTLVHHVDPPVRGQHFTTAGLGVGVVAAGAAHPFVAAGVIMYGFGQSPALLVVADAANLAGIRGVGDLVGAVALHAVRDIFETPALQVLIEAGHKLFEGGRMTGAAVHPRQMFRMGPVFVAIQAGVAVYAFQPGMHRALDHLGIHMQAAGDPPNGHLELRIVMAHGAALVFRRQNRQRKQEQQPHHPPLEQSPHRPIPLFMIAPSRHPPSCGSPFATNLISTTRPGSPRAGCAR